MNEEHQAKYPLYFKAVDAAGKIFALLCAEAENAITIIGQSGAGFKVMQVATWADVSANIGGQVLPAETQEYNDTLHLDWRFKFSEAVLYNNGEAAAPVKVEEETPVAGTAEDVTTVAGEDLPTEEGEAAAPVIPADHVGDDEDEAEDEEGKE